MLISEQSICLLLFDFVVNGENTREFSRYKLVKNKAQGFKPSSQLFANLKISLL